MNPTREELEQEGYESLTYEYFIPQERFMYIRAIQQLGRKDFKVLSTDTTREIFIRKQTP